MSQRLAELQRQRALLHDHLAWLDREIAAERARASGTSARVAAPAEATSVSSGPAGRPATTRLLSVTAPDATLASPADETFATSVNLGTAVAPPATPARDGEAILEQYRVAPDSLRKDVRKGCFLYFALAFGLLGIGVAALYLLFRM